jgi:hypothetical protein
MLSSLSAVASAACWTPRHRNELRRSKNVAWDYTHYSACAVSAGSLPCLVIQFRLGLLSERAFGNPAGRRHCVTAYRDILTVTMHLCVFLPVAIPGGLSQTRCGGSPRIETISQGISDACTITPHWPVCSGSRSVTHLSIQQRVGVYTGHMPLYCLGCRLYLNDCRGTLTRAAQRNRRVIVCNSHT